jgi:hypothetical protein
MYCIYTQWCTLQEEKNEIMFADEQMELEIIMLVKQARMRKTKLDF